MFFKSNVLYHIASLKSKVSEGGKARENAIVENLKQHSIFIYMTKNRLLNIIKFFTFLLFSRNNKIFIYYPIVGIPLSNRYFFLKYLRKMFVRLFVFAQKNNKFYIDIADFPMEQAIDLELPVPEYLKDIEPFIFNNKSTYFFASNSMRNYAIKKYNLSNNHANVWINGGHSVNKELISSNIGNIDMETINYVYAGTLNKGRQIEAMIKIFSEISDKNLILMGNNGEWLNQLDLPKNIIYLGSLEEKHAHYIVSLCDVGLIPYNDQRPYYNIAYPTKLSFYITAGISFLSTNVQEVKNINNKYSIGYIKDIESWDLLIKSLSKSEIIEKKENVINIKNKFLWSNIINKDMILNPNSERIL